MNWFKNARTVVKLMSVFGVMAVLIAFVGYEGISAASTINDMLNTLYERDMTGLENVKDLQVQIAIAGRETRQAILATGTDQAQRAVQAASTSLGQAAASLEKAQKTLITDEAKALAAKLREDLSTYRTGVDRVAQEILAGKKDAAVAEMSKTAVIAARIGESGDNLAAVKSKLGKQFYEDSDVVYFRSRQFLIALICIAVVIAVGLGIYIARLISHPLVQTVGVLDAVAKGDLTRSLDVSTKDEVGKMAVALNQAVSNIRETLAEVRDSANGVASASQELASASEELSSGAQEQASSQEETSATMEEIGSTVKQNAESAKQANQLAAGARDIAENGGQVVGSAVSAMGEINSASKRIAEIITTIDEIAFQTNLLALNAAVEAARAGEQGRGFAVVAAEVRNLAQRSATAAKEIKGLIQDSVRKVENGSELVNRSGHTLQEIVSSVKRVTDIVAEISAASQEQAAGIDQVGKAMAQMDQVTQTNSAQTEELSSTAQTLAVHAEQMQALVSRFVLESETHRSVRTAAPTAGVAKTLKSAKRPTPPVKRSAGAASSSLQSLSRATVDSQPAGVEAGSGFAEF